MVKLHVVLVCTAKQALPTSLMAAYQCKCAHHLNLQKTFYDSSLLSSIQSSKRVFIDLMHNHISRRCLADLREAPQEARKNVSLPISRIGSLFTKRDLP